ncbi:hypothetical protein [Mucilaginibacter kameinonensis]|uniref:hypothetical protein n=1 Tax=Mucilaginibacter kameinonensis TaxID=452286 RepID=UPI000EF7AEB6|nr:hypothetical protein [Mucilaginibacter kameinonensis]
MAEIVEVVHLEQLNRILDYIGIVLRKRVENGHQVQFSYENITNHIEGLDEDPFRNGIDALLEVYKPGFLKFDI